MRFAKEKVEELRERCRTDLYFLDKFVLGKDLEEQPHKEMCAQFVQKRPGLPVAEAETQKQRLIMCPRGSFKSTISVTDCVQWTIAYPNIRILVLTAEKNLSSAFAEEYKNYFVVRGEPTAFQELFPEFCVLPNKKESATEFTTPARSEFKKEPTLWSNSIMSNLPGWHCDVLICDDVVTDKNAENPEQIDKIIKKFSFAVKLVDPGGYITVVGTPYAPNDLYDYLPKALATGELRVYARPAWTVKKSAKSKKEEELGPDDYELFFPARLTYEFLVKAKKFDPVTFATQYLIDARSAAKQLFSHELMQSVVLPWQSIPEQLNYYAAWDLAYGETLLTDYTTGVVGATDSQGRFYVIEYIRGRFNAQGIAFYIADFMRRYPLQLTAIEDMLGAKWLEPLIQQEAEKLGADCRIYWLPVERQKDAKIQRIARLVPMMQQHKFFVSNSLAGVETFLQQFEDFTGAKNAKDDVPDCCSFFPSFVPMQAAPTEEDNLRMWETVRREAMHELLYPVFTPPVEQTVQDLEPVYNEYF